MARKRPTAGETYTVVKGEQEPSVRCKGCERVIPMRTWWRHVCVQACEVAPESAGGAPAGGERKVEPEA